MSPKTSVAQEVGDFTTNWRVLPISLLAIATGILSTLVAVALLQLIALFTNLFFFQRWSTALISPAGNKLGIFEVLVPIGGALIIGLMARYGSERIRGHGIPEAIESILINGSRVQPRLAILKPISSAISIGSGGPFGAEGPIIMTGGALGSMVAQFFHLTSNERKTLLVAGAAAGMSATFAAPVAAVLLAVELLLFEWKPRSFIPVALASATAGAARRYLIGLGPLFPVPHHAIFIGPEGLLGCALAGILAGALSALLTMAVYASEDFFQKLPIHWMWWPAIGGLVIGVGGLDLPAGARRRLRNHRGAPARRRAEECDCRHSPREIHNLGCVARLGDVGRRARAVVDDGRRARRRAGRVPAQRRGRILAAGQHGGDPRRNYAIALYRNHFRA